MSALQQLILSRLVRLIPPPVPTPASGLTYGRLEAASFFFAGSDADSTSPYPDPTQETQATLLEEQIFIGAACITQPAVPSVVANGSALTPGLSYGAPNQDPRYAQFAYYNFASAPLDPAPSLVSSPSSLGTGTATSAGASGTYLDAWGSALGNQRWQGETDAAYAVRMVSDIARPSTTNYALACTVAQIFGTTPWHVTVTEVLQTSTIVNALNQTVPCLLWVGNSAYPASPLNPDPNPYIPRLNVAPGTQYVNSGGAFIVKVNMAYVSGGATDVYPLNQPSPFALDDRTIGGSPYAVSLDYTAQFAAAQNAINLRKAAGTECLSLTAM